MAWAAIVNGRVLPLVWFPKGVSVNSDNYLKLLRDVLWPSIQEEAENEGYFYQLDGAPPHCARKCLDFVLDIYLLQQSDQQKNGYSLASMQSRPKPLRLLVLGWPSGDCKGEEPWIIASWSLILSPKQLRRWRVQKWYVLHKTSAVGSNYATRRRGAISRPRSKLQKFR